jgi:hypothetical protein
MLTLATRPEGDSRQQPLEYSPKSGPRLYRAVCLPYENNFSWGDLYAPDLSGKHDLTRSLGLLLKELGARHGVLLPPASAFIPRADQIVQSCRLQGEAIALPPGPPLYRNLATVTSGVMLEIGEAVVLPYRGGGIAIAADMVALLPQRNASSQIIQAMARVLRRRDMRIDRTACQVLFGAPTSGCAGLAVLEAARLGFASADHKCALDRNRSFAYPGHESRSDTHNLVAVVRYA